MKIGVCCIVKQENLYLRDFVEYYKKKGFDNIILWDNNDENGEYPQQVIGDYISSGFVIYEDCRGKYRYQLEAYRKTQIKYEKDFDWIAYFDCDEYIELTEYNNIKSFVKQDKFNDCDGIVVYWRSFGDNGLVHYDNRPVLERFTEFYTQKDNEPCNFKLILKTDNINIHNITFTDANWFTYYYYDRPLMMKKTNGEVATEFWHELTYDGAILNHYHTLTIEEFLYRRFGRRSYADRNSNFNKDVVMGIFTKYNEITPEKQLIIDNFFSTFKYEDDNYIVQDKTEKVKIFTITHVPDFKLPESDLYQIVAFDDVELGDEKDNAIIIDSKNVGIEYDLKRFCSEWSQIFHLWKNCELPEYVGIAHYRRYFDYKNADEVIKDMSTHDCICSSTTLLLNNYEFYKTYHSKQDIDILSNIISEHFSEYKETFEEVLSCVELYPCNLFIMNVKMFKQLCELQYSILKIFCDTIGVYTDDDALKFVKDRGVEDKPSEEWYQIRIFAFLSERITTMFIKKNCKNIKFKDIILK